MDVAEHDEVDRVRDHLRREGEIVRDDLRRRGAGIPDALKLEVAEEDPQVDGAEVRGPIVDPLAPGGPGRLVGQLPRDLLAQRLPHLLDDLLRMPVRDQDEADLPALDLPALDPGGADQLDVSVPPVVAKGTGRRRPPWRV